MSRTADQSLILAAGRGSRMGGLTSDRPKCLVELGGKTLLEWQLAALARGGAGDAALVGGYMSRRLEDRGLPMFHNPDWERTNMVRSLLCAGERLERASTVVSYADIVYHPDCVDLLRRAEGDVVLCADTLWQALWTLRFENPLADAETFRHRGGRLLEIGGRAASLAEIEAQYMGLFRLTPRGYLAVRTLLAELSPEAVDRLDMTAMLRLMLKRGTDIRVVFTAGRWCETDSGADLEAYRLALGRADSGRPWTHDWRFDLEGTG